MSSVTRSPSIVLLCPTIPAVTDQARKSFDSWYPTTSNTAAQSLGGSQSSSAPSSLATSKESLCQETLHLMSNAHVCPYPRRGLLSGFTSSSPPSSPPSEPLVFSDPVPKSCSGGSAKNMDTYSLDFERITNTVNKLEASGWYYGKLSWQQATTMLQSMPLGTFLMRDSSDPLYLFALSVQTERGPTSIRIHYDRGQFKLVAEELIAGNMPLFDCVVKLVDYYVTLSQTDKAKSHVWLDETGRRDRQICLSKPLYHQVPQLQHLCRLVINEQVPVQRINELNLPKSLQCFIRDYPYQR